MLKKRLFSLLLALALMAALPALADGVPAACPVCGASLADGPCEEALTALLTASRWCAQEDGGWFFLDFYADHTGLESGSRDFTWALEGDGRLSVRHGQDGATVRWTLLNVNGLTHLSSEDGRVLAPGQTELACAPMGNWVCTTAFEITLLLDASHVFTLDNDGDIYIGDWSIFPRTFWTKPPSSSSSRAWSSPESTAARS